MAMTGMEIRGFMGDIKQLMEDNQADLQDKGLNVAAWVPQLAEKLDTSTKLNSAQEALKTDLKNATNASRAADKDGYNTSSSMLDAIVGAFGKSTPIGKQAARIRSNALRKYQKKKPSG